MIRLLGSSCSAVLVGLVAISSACGAESSVISLVGKDLGSWREPRGEWQIVGDVKAGGEGDRFLVSAPGEGVMFDQNGKKTENARFVKVAQNDVLAHENVELTGPTRAATYNDEKPTGPLMLQGDHGPVAYRNISIKPIRLDSD